MSLHCCKIQASRWDFSIPLHGTKCLFSTHCNRAKTREPGINYSHSMAGKLMRRSSKSSMSQSQKQMHCRQRHKPYSGLWHALCSPRRWFSHALGSPHIYRYTLLECILPFHILGIKEEIRLTSLILTLHLLPGAFRIMGNIKMS